MIIPFMPAEQAKGDLRGLFTAGDAFGPHCVLFQVVTNDFVAANRAAVRAFLDDYVRGLHWFYDPANRAKAVQLTADFTKSSKDVLESYFLTPRDYYRDINGCVAAELIQVPIDAMLREGFIDRPVEVVKHVDTSLLPLPCKA
jgi:NitT/TauT family transport system substrate-binding protein